MSGTSAALPACTPRQWIVCADDFAIDTGAVDGIVELLEDGRITATSALVDSPLWRSAAQALPADIRRRTPGAMVRAEVGLHLNLTQAFGSQTAAVWPLGELIARCAVGAVPSQALQAAIGHQLDAFEDAMGRGPDYVDGHQHVHQFAVVREALLSALQRRYGSDLPWVRSTRPPAAVRDLKARGIAALGDRRLRQLAGALHIRTNAYLVGVYNFRGDAASYWRRLEQWVQSGPQATVLMTHPAARAQPTDALGAARTMEFATLRSARFATLLADARIAPTTGARLFAPIDMRSAPPAQAQAPC